MDRPTFAGALPVVKATAARHARPELAGRAHALGELSRLAGLVSQAYDAGNPDRAGILAHAEDSLLVLRLAHEAAQQIVADARRDLAIEEPTGTVGPPAPTKTPGRARKE